MIDAAKVLSLDKRDFTTADKMLFMNDFKKLAAEYFECDGVPQVDVTKTDDGYSVCVIFSARRIKQVKQIM